MVAQRRGAPVTADGTGAVAERHRDGHLVCGRPRERGCIQRKRTAAREGPLSVATMSVRLRTLPAAILTVPELMNATLKVSVAEVVALPTFQVPSFSTKPAAPAVVSIVSAPVWLRVAL